MTFETREIQLSAAFVKLADTLITDFDIVDLLDWLIEECVDILDITAGGLLLVDADGVLRLMASTSAEAQFVDILQLSAGKGPCLDSFHSGIAVVVDDIRRDAASWPDFSAEALSQGFRAVHTTPLRLRGEIIGCMNLFNATPGQPEPADIAVAQALADVATIGILHERTLRNATIVAEQLQQALDSRVVIEQAKGVLVASAGLSVDDAFIALRAHARSHNVTLRSVADEVVARKLDFSPL